MMPLQLVAQDSAFIDSLPESEFAQIDDIKDTDIELAASFSKLKNKNNLAAYPFVMKDAQRFVLDLGLEIKDNFVVYLMDQYGSKVETLFNSRLEVFQANHNLTLDVHTRLDAGTYFVVVETKDAKRATKLMKFGDGNIEISRLGKL